MIFAIIFATTSFDNKQNVAGVFEWIIAFVFTFYVLTFSMDLLPASRSAQAHTNIEFLHKREAENGEIMMNETGYATGNVGATSAANF